ncbi:MAG: hypothetical protein JXR13_13065 [Thalassovita sp.]
MTNEIEVVVDIDATEEEKQAIYQRLLKRNMIRRETGLPPLDIKASYVRQVRKLEDQRYNAAIEPHLAAAYERYPSENGITARLKQHCNVISYAESLARVPVHQKRPVSFVDFMKLYTGGGLPLVPLKRT